MSSGIDLVGLPKKPSQITNEIWSRKLKQKSSIGHFRKSETFCIYIPPPPPPLPLSLLPPPPPPLPPHQAPSHLRESTWTHWIHHFLSWFDKFINWENIMNWPQTCPRSILCEIIMIINHQNGDDDDENDDHDHDHDHLHQGVDLGRLREKGWWLRKFAVSTRLSTSGQQWFLYLIFLYLSI